MEANITNLHNKSNIIDKRIYNNRNLLEQDFHNDKRKKNKKHNMSRPAEAVSFGGSALSLGESAGKIIAKTRPLNAITAFVADNEVAYRAIYSMIFAGILKPYCIIKKKGSADEKDKVMIATKNSLQAFVGTFLSLTIGGGLIKKAYDVVKNNFKLLIVNSEENKLEVLNPSDKKALKVAKDKIVKEKSNLKNKFNYAKDNAVEKEGIAKVKTFVKYFFGDYKYKPTEKEIIDQSIEMVDNLVKEHKPIFDKNVNFIQTLKDKNILKGSKVTLEEAFESFWKCSTDWITVISKAKISSMLLPAVTAFIFARMKLENTKNDEIEKINNPLSSLPLFNTPSYQNSIEKYAKVIKPENNNISFNGGMVEKCINSFAKGVENLAVTPFGEGCVKLLSKTKKPSPAMSYLESGILTTYWVGSTSMSKKIDPDQKLGLNIHTVLVTLVSSLASFVLDTVLDPIIGYSEKGYENIINEAVENIKNNTDKNPEEILKQACSKLYAKDSIVESLIKDGKLINENDVKQTINTLTAEYGKKLGKFKSLTVFTFIVRFLVPVLTVEASAKIKKMIKQKAKEKKEKRANQA